MGVGVVGVGVQILQFWKTKQKQQPPKKNTTPPPKKKKKKNPKKQGVKFYSRLKKGVYTAERPY